MNEHDMTEQEKEALTTAADEIAGDPKPAPAPRQWRSRRGRRVRYLGQGRMVVRGSVSGTEYRFHGHAATVSVSADDFDEIVARTRQTRACCGPRSRRVRRLFAPA